MLNDDAMDGCWREDVVPGAVYEEYPHDSAHDDDAHVDSERIGVKNKELGRRGEAAAARYLEFVGYEILERNWVCPAGEADIVARQGDTLVFVEVKTRKDERFGRPALAVDRRKRQALCRGASAFIRRAHYPSLTYRFDIIEVVGSRDSPDPPVVRHIEDAFRFPVGRIFTKRATKS